MSNDNDPLHTWISPALWPRRLPLRLAWINGVMVFTVRVNGEDFHLTKVGQVRALCQALGLKIDEVTQ